jgi:hypothetical protein
MIPCRPQRRRLCGGVKGVVLARHPTSKASRQAPERSGPRGQALFEPERLAVAPECDSPESRWQIQEALSGCATALAPHGVARLFGRLVTAGSPRTLAMHSNSAHSDPSGRKTCGSPCDSVGAARKAVRGLGDPLDPVLLHIVRRQARRCRFP